METEKIDIERALDTERSHLSEEEKQKYIKKYSLPDSLLSAGDSACNQG